MWTEITRPNYQRDSQRYAGDVTDAEWESVEPYMPAAKSVGRPRTTDLREVVNAILYLLMAVREAVGCEASPSAGVIDSQSVKTTESGGDCGFDAGKKVKGRKRHIPTDTGGLLVIVLVHAASIQDRDAAPAVLAAIRTAFPWLRHVFADGAYGGQKLERAMRRLSRWTLEIVKRPSGAQGFEVLPRRWVVERTLAWLNRNRRPSKDFETSIASAQALIMIASVQLMVCRLARA